MMRRCGFRSSALQTSAEAVAGVSQLLRTVTAIINPCIQDSTPDVAG